MEHAKYFDLLFPSNIPCIWWKTHLGGELFQLMNKYSEEDAWISSIVCLLTPQLKQIHKTLKRSNFKYGVLMFPNKRASKITSII